MNSAEAPNAAISPKPSASQQNAAVAGTSLTRRWTWPITVPDASASNGSVRGSPMTPKRWATSSGSRGHPLADLPLPDLARAIPVDLDAVLVGVGEVDRLADVVVRHADERDLLARGVREPAGEVGALGHEQREVV